MRKPIDISKMKFGKWTCLDYVGNSKWRCICECGNYSNISGIALRSGNSNQCRKCQFKLYIKKEEFRDTFFKRYINSAKVRNLQFNITKEYVYELFLKQNRKCALSGIDIKFANTSKEHLTGFTTASLDRIDSSKGYVEGNVQWIHKDINKIKNNISQERFLELCQKINLKYNQDMI